MTKFLHIWQWPVQLYVGWCYAIGSIIYNSWVLNVFLHVLATCSCLFQNVLIYYSDIVPNTIIVVIRLTLLGHSRQASSPLTKLSPLSHTSFTSTKTSLILNASMHLSPSKGVQSLRDLCVKRSYFLNSLSDYRLVFEFWLNLSSFPFRQFY